MPVSRPRRRFDHAHQVRRPIGAIDPRLAPAIGRQPRAFGRWNVLAVVALAIVGVSVATALLRPGGLGLTAAERAAPTTAAPEAGASTGRPTDGPSMGPHGDAVSPVGGVPATRDVADLPRRGERRVTPASRLMGYGWPIEKARITNAFGLGRPGSFEVGGVTFHNGIDISSFCGARIVAAHSGVVVAAGRRSEGWLGWVGDLGPFRTKLDKQQGWGGQAITVVIDDGNGYRSVYAHLARKAVQPGDRVDAGQLIGWEGASGNASGCHLHYELFDPSGRGVLQLERRIAEETGLPRLLMARVDPLVVLPPPSVARITWGWGAR